MKLGTLTPTFRLGSTTPSRIYLGANLVWSATVNSLFEDFESGSSRFASTSGSGLFEVSSAAARSGLYGLRASVPAGHHYAWDNSFQITPSPTLRAAVWVRMTGGTNLSGIHLGSANDGYSLFLDTRNGSGTTSAVQIRRGGGTALTLLVSATPVIAANQWYYLEMRWQQTGLISAIVKNSSGDIIANISKSDTTYTTAHVGLRSYNNADFDDFEFVP